MRKLIILAALALANPALAAELTMDAVLGTTMPEVQTKLTEMGFALQKAVKKKEKKKGKSRISRRDMIDFYNLMIYQVNAGVSVIEALGTASSECKNHKLKAALSTVERKVKSGMMFFEALDGQAAAFPANVVNMVRAGEMSCKLPDTFKSPNPATLGSIIGAREARVLRTGWECGPMPIPHKWDTF